MSGIATAIVGGAVISGAVSAYGASKAAGAAESAADTQAQSEMAQLEYLKEVEAVPQAYREQAIQQLGSLYGLPGTGVAPGTTPTQGVATAPVQQPSGTYAMLNPAYSEWEANQRGMVGSSGAYGEGGFDPGPAPQQWITADQMPPVQQPQQPGQVEQAGYAPLGRQDFVAGLREDPFYLDLLGAGEEAVLRGASATGGLRSGTASENLARNNQNILRGLYSERVGGLQGLAGLPSNVNQIGNVMGGIGATQAAGQVAAGQAWQQGLQGVSSAVGSGVGNYMWAQGRGLI